MNFSLPIEFEKSRDEGRNKNLQAIVDPLIRSLMNVVAKDVEGLNMRGRERSLPSDKLLERPPPKIEIRVFR